MIENKLTVRGLAKEVGIGRMTLERILDGRYATHDELEKIASGLSITVDRLRQKDTQPVLMELEELLQSGRNPWRALQLAQDLVGLAIGRTEMADMYSLLGRAYYDLRRFDEAHEALERSYQLINKSGDLYRIGCACNNLLASYLERADYESLHRLLDEAGDVFKDDLEQLGRLSHYRGLVASRTGDRASAKKYYLESYDYYKQVGDRVLIGRIQINLANLEFHDQNYQKSKELLEHAKRNLESGTVVIQAIADKDLARTLLFLGESEEALALIDYQLDIFRNLGIGIDQPDLQAKFLLLRAEITQDVATAETALALKSISRDLKCHIADFLTMTYMKRNDYTSALKYYALMKDHLPEKFTNFKRSVWF